MQEGGEELGFGFQALLLSSGQSDPPSPGSNPPLWLPGNLSWSEKPLFGLRHAAQHLGELTPFEGLVASP